MVMNDNEYQAVVFTTFKSQSGFVVNATQRGETLDGAYKLLGGFIKAQGGMPYEKQGGYPKKEKEYTGELCPLDHGRLVKSPPGGKTIAKCENNRWNRETKKAEGCSYVVWDKAI